MDTRTALLADAFTTEPTAGTSFGVVPDATDLEPDQLRAVADELGRPTAFLTAAEDADRDLRVVDPLGERGRYEDPAIAALAALAARGDVAAGELTLGTAGGPVDAGVFEGVARVDAPDATVAAVDVDYETVDGALGLDPATLRDVGADLPLARAAVGERRLVVPVNYFEHLQGATPDPQAVGDLCAAVDADGVYAFTFDTLAGDATLHARSFRATGKEELATAAGAGACCAYVRRHGALDGEREELVVEQGHVRDRPGRVHVETDGESVRVGGRGAVAMTGDISVPPTEEDDIIEA